MASTPNIEEENKKMGDDDSSNTPDRKKLDESSSKDRTVYVGGLSDFSSGELRQRFSKHGQIVDVRVPPQTGHYNKYAFIEFSKKEEAYTAVVKENRTEFLGRIMNVDIDDDGHKSRKGRKQDSDDLREKLDSSTSRRTIWVGGLSKETSRNDLKARFSQYGKIITSRLCSCQDQQFDHAFIEFNIKEEADAAIENENGKVFSGFPIAVQIQRSTSVVGERSRSPRRSKSVRPSSSRRSRSRSRSMDRHEGIRSRVYVRQGTSSVRKADIWNQFEVYGKIVKVQMAFQYCIIQFQKAEDANRAIEGEKGLRVSGKKVKVERSTR